MKKILLAGLSLSILGLSVYLGAQPQTERVKIRLKLVDAANGKSVAGIVRVLDADGRHVELPGLFDRMAGMTKDLPGVHWYVIRTGGADAMVPRGKLRLEAVSGLETDTARQEIDLTKNVPAEITLRLPFLFHPDSLGLAAGNTHLHLRGFSLDVADGYLRQIPAADGLRVMFVSYLERDKDDLSYITNKYSIGPMPKLAATGVLFNNGQEHRHNFTSYGEGYGHVMFLNIKELVQPVSIGPGITNKGFDDLPLRPGMDNARKQGGTVLWCHNTFGVEGILAALAKRFDAFNVFDGSRTGKYEDKYYRYLNLGLKMPISTGTDWFMYDMSRVYAEPHGQLTIASWLDALKAGRCQATNGPLLTLEVDGRKIGDVIDLQEAKSVKIRASAVGRHPVGKLELIQNGKVVKSQSAKKAGRVEMSHDVRLDAPAWFALRIDGEAKNEFQKVLFAHTSPIYVNFQGRGVFDVDEGLALLKQVEEAHAAIKTRGHFSSPEASRKMLALYDDAAADLRERINKRR